MKAKAAKTAYYRRLLMQFNRKERPFSNPLSTLIVPLCARTSCQVIPSPGPLLPSVRTRDLLPDIARTRCKFE